MTDDAKHPTGALQDALDHRLDPAEQAALEEHLKSCPSCRHELDALRWTKAQAASLKQPDEPLALAARLRGVLDEEDRIRSGGVGSSSRRLRSFGTWIAAAAVLVIGFWIVVSFQARSLPASIAEEYRAYASNRLALESESTVPSELEAYFAGEGLPFPLRVFDLGMMGFQLEGGSTHPVGGRAGAIIAYRGSDGRLLLCRMFLGSVTDLPPPMERRSNQDIAFQVYRDGELTLVFWQEGGVVCVLVGSGDSEAVIQLAFGKAVKV